MLLSEGKTCTDVLVVHPLHSVWMEFDHHCFANHTNERSSFIDRNFEWVCNTLSMNQFEYHLGDEYLMAKYGKVEGQQLRMNHCVYDTVVIPPAYSLDEPVYQLLMRFAENGGILYHGCNELCLRGFYDNSETETRMQGLSLGRTLAQR